MKIPFVKMHGIGNDMILLDNREGNIQLSKKEIQHWCDRHFGIGADGLILVEKDTKADCFMKYFNSDGNSVEMCGNGIRCTAEFYKKIAGFQGTSLKINTRSGVKKIICKKNHTYAVNMGCPMFQSKNFPQKSIKIEELSLSFVSLGNPHAVAFMTDIEKYPLEIIGPRIETNPHFPNGINVEIVEMVNKKKLKIRVWERGSGLTLACGTGACAAFAISHRNKKVDDTVQAFLPGGKLEMKMNKNGEVIMTGSVETVFEGNIEIKCHPEQPLSS